MYSGDTFSNYDNYQIDDDREIGISTEHNGPYAGYTGPINRYLGIAYKIKYKYNATYNPNVKKIEEFF